MRKETSKWGKDVKKTVIDKNMTLKQLAETISYSNTMVSQVINGRYSNSSYREIAKKKLMIFLELKDCQRELKLRMNGVS